MKNLLFILITLFGLSTYVHASFPVTAENTATESVITQTNEADPAESTATLRFSFGGFILGFLLGLIGVGLAYLFSDNPDFIRSAWIGAGTWAVLYLLILASAA